VCYLPTSAVFYWPEGPDDLSGSDVQLS
jgi:hypothetical protein